MTTIWYGSARETVVRLTTMLIAIITRPTPITNHEIHFAERGVMTDAPPERSRRRSILLPA
jgi:hypothetical protein